MWEYQYPDELYHWKYIKKKKINGKWRYYYDVKDALGYDERAEYAKSIRDYNTKKSNADSYNSIQSDPTRVKFYDQKKSDQMYKEASNASKKLSEAKKNFYNTPLGKLESIKDAIDRGRRAVADLFEGAAEKIRPGRDNFHLKY